MDRIHLAQNRDWWQALADMVICSGYECLALIFKWHPAATILCCMHCLVCFIIFSQHIGYADEILK
jgi:hypothetical protein